MAHELCNDDGSFAGTLTPGNNTAAAVLRDSPSGWPDDTWIDAITVPVCIDARSGCVDRLLGYEYWLFMVNTGGSVGAPFSELGRDWHRDVVDLAAQAWNARAPGHRNDVFPALSRLR